MRWGDENEVKLTQKWNPLCRSLPYATLTHHPVYSKRDQLPPRQCEVPGAGYEDPTNPVSVYDVNNFLCALKEASSGMNIQVSHTVHLNTLCTEQDGCRSNQDG